MTSLRWAISLVLVVAGCTDRVSTTDAFVLSDGGTDAATLVDAPAARDTGVDAPVAPDAGRDAAVVVDAGHDAATVPDSGCSAPPPVCMALPSHCHYDNTLDSCRCGMAICDNPEPCSPACTGTQYCQYAVDTCGGAGECTIRPDVCTGTIDPVCACNGRTYNNACDAAVAGQSILYHGACATPTDCRSTGCPSGQTCNACRGTGSICMDDGTVC